MRRALRVRGMRGGTRTQRVYRLFFDKRWELIVLYGERKEGLGQMGCVE